MKDLVFICLCALGLSIQAQSVLSWAASSNRLANSSFVMTRRTDTTVDVYNFPSNQCQFTPDQLAFGTNRFAVAQISTNPAGWSATTPFSGEVWIVKKPVVVVEQRSTNIFILTSTNLGADAWAFAGSNTVMFPTADAQRYFKAMADLQIRRTNVISYPPAPK